MEIYVHEELWWLQYFCCALIRVHIKYYILNGFSESASLPMTYA